MVKMYLFPWVIMLSEWSCNLIFRFCKFAVSDVSDVSLSHKKNCDSTFETPFYNFTTFFFFFSRYWILYWRSDRLLSPVTVTLMSGRNLAAWPSYRGPHQLWDVFFVCFFFSAKKCISKPWHSFTIFLGKPLLFERDSLVFFRFYGPPINMSIEMSCLVFFLVFKS